MDDELADIFLGGDIGDGIIGKQPDWTKPFRTFAIVLGICIIGNILISIFVEKYRLQASMQEVRNMTLNGIQCSVEEVQNLGENEMEYLFDDFGNPTSEYAKYLELLKDTAVNRSDSELLRVVQLLKNGDSGGEKYTPLSFNLTYLNAEKLQGILESNLFDIFDKCNSTEFEDGKDNFGSVLEALIFGKDRVRFDSCEVSVGVPRVIDITSVNRLDEDDKAMYRAVYGTENQNVSKLDGLGLTDKHYLIVYQVEYKIKWWFYTRSLFFKNPGSMPDENGDGFSSMCMLTDEYTELYYITN